MWKCMKSTNMVKIGPNMFYYITGFRKYDLLLYIFRLLPKLLKIIPKLSYTTVTFLSVYTYMAFLSIET